MEYCTNCKKMVEPKKDVSVGFLILLFCLGVIPGIIYWAIKPATCPSCGMRKWGQPPAGELTPAPGIKAKELGAASRK